LPRAYVDGQAKCRLVGIPPGTALKNGLLYLSRLMGVIGGCVLALLAWAVASIDQFAMCAYGFSPGCTGFVLLAGFVVSAIKKVIPSHCSTRCYPETHIPPRMCRSPPVHLMLND
jgi:hypothetical protein